LTGDLQGGGNLLVGVPCGGFEERASGGKQRGRSFTLCRSKEWPVALAPSGRTCFETRSLSE
jgi:hypothetical protein